PAFSSATERRDARRAEPQSERERRNRDDPPPRFAARADERGGRDDEQTDGQSAEKQAESAPLHARTLFLRQRSLPLPLVLAVALALLLLEQLVGALLPLLLRPVHVFLRLIGHAGKMPKTEGYNLHRTQGRSSVGRAAVSKTVGRGFESLRPCSRDPEQLPKEVGGSEQEPEVHRRPPAIRRPSSSRARVRARCEARRTSLSPRVIAAGSGRSIRVADAAPARSRAGRRPARRIPAAWQSVAVPPVATALLARASVVRQRRRMGDRDTACGAPPSPSEGGCCPCS